MKCGRLRPASRSLAGNFGLTRTAPLLGMRGITFDVAAACAERQTHCDARRRPDATFYLMTILRRRECLRFVDRVIEISDAGVE